jgi:hypothetical protein
VMLPLPSEDALKLALVHESVAPIDGPGTANPADATAAASTRLMERFMDMGLPRKSAAKCHHSTEQALRHIQDGMLCDDVSPCAVPPHGRLLRTNGSFRLNVAVLEDRLYRRLYASEKKGGTLGPALCH